MSFNSRLLAKRPLVFVGATVLLSGCWTPPNADVRPPGPARVIQKGIVVSSTLRRAVVQSVDTQRRTLLIQVPGAPGIHEYRAGPSIADLGRIPAGAVVHATVSEELMVYVSGNGAPPGMDVVPGPTQWKAKILSVDPSYRVLTVQNPGGLTEDFKVGLEVRLAEMQAGDEVLIQAPEIVSLTVR